MTSVEFIQAGYKIAGKKRGYQVPFSEKIGVSVITVKRYAAGESVIPMPVRLLIKELLK
ncbi:MAG: hypothetical protein WC714_28400 [Candidatus Obscuribacterales bacterium]|jgi:hypothetical protein